MIVKNIKTMKKVLFILLAGMLLSCGSNKPTQEQKAKAERYVENLVNAGINIYAGKLTDANILVLAVDAYQGANFDKYAETYLEDAISHGLDIKGVAIVDIKNCQFGDSGVVGERIGRAYK